MFDWLVDKMMPAPDDLEWGPPAATMPRDAAIERRVREDPDDRDRLAVYVDFLGQAGDTRGPVLAAWLAGTGQNGDPAISRAVDRWVEAHSRRLTKNVRATGGTSMAASFRGPLLDGWTRTIAFSVPNLGPILEAPESVALRRVGYQGNGNAAAWVATMEQRARPCPLRELSVASHSMQPIDLSQRWQAFRGLRRIELSGHFAGFGEVRLPDAEHLLLEATFGLGWNGLQGFLAPGLRTLEIGPNVDRFALGLILPVCPHLVEISLTAPTPETLAALVGRLEGRRLVCLRITDPDDALLELRGSEALKRIDRLEITLKTRTLADHLRIAMEESFADRLTVRKHRT